MCRAAALCLLLFAAGASADSNIILPPPANASGPAKLLVWVPGGKVPNTAYQGWLSQVQTELAGSVQLWVSVAACLEHLCVPIPTTTSSITKALNSGQSKSGVSDPKDVWLGGHSLGGVAADAYTQKNGGGSVQGGLVLTGAWVKGGADSMLKYPVPVAMFTAEFDSTTARATNMAPFYAAAASSAAQLARTPVVLLPGVDHSDFDAHHPDVPGDLPSASSPAAASAEISGAVAEFLRQQVAGAAPSARWGELLALSEQMFAPVNAALAVERSGDWCAAVQRSIAGPALSAGLTVTADARDAKPPSPWDAPSVAAGNGSVAVAVHGWNTYGGGLAAGPYSTAQPAGCRMASRAAIARAAGAAAGAEPADACRAANEAAWAYVVAGAGAPGGAPLAPQRVLDRYNSSAPCNGCKPAARVSYSADTPAADVAALEKVGLSYDLGEALTVGSAALVTDYEHSCMLLGPSRVLDILYFDAYAASCYP